MEDRSAAHKILDQNPSKCRGGPGTLSKTKCQDAGSSEHLNLFLVCFSDDQTNLSHSITMLPTKQHNAKRRSYFSKTQLVGSHSKQHTQERTQASSTTERFAILLDFQTFCARLENVRNCSVRGKIENLFGFWFRIRRDEAARKS